MKFVFSQREHAAGLLKAVLPAAIVEAIDWSTLVLENQTFVSRALRHRYIDLLISARLHGALTYFYALVEQQRKVEELMILRMGVYTFRAWERIVKDAPELKEIPPIVPILIHHSDTGWTASTSFRDVVAVPESLRPLLAPFTPSFGMHVVDLSPGQATSIVDVALTSLGQVALWALSVAGDDVRFEQELGRMARALDAVLAGRDAVDALHALLRYLVATHRRLGAPRIANLLETTASKGQKKVIMDELDAFKVEGRREGRVEGRTRMLLAQLNARFGPVPPEAKAKILAAKEATLARWSLRVLSEPTLDAVLDARAKKAAPARRRARTS